MRLSLLATALLLLAGGCAHYEYDLIAPQELARQIPTKIDTVFTLEPFEYRMRTVDNHLVLRILNSTDSTIQLLGERSSIVDPSGQAHVLRAAPIPPHSFLKLIFPPLHPRLYDTSFGVGVVGGVTRRSDTHDEPPFCRTPDTQPLNMDIYDESDPYDWDWKGDGDARLTLVYASAGDKTFRHEFTFRRRKM